MIGGNSAILGMVEGEIAKLVVKEYEGCQNILKFVMQENEQLKKDKERQSDLIESLRRDIDQIKKENVHKLDLLVQ